MTISRRNVAKGIAWSVPVIAAASALPAYAGSYVPPEPEFDWGKAVKNPGGSCTQTCIPKQSYGVPVTVKNTGPTNLIIRFTDYKLGATSSGGGGTSFGINNVGVKTGQVLDAAACSNRVTQCTDTCTGATPANSVCVPAGTASMSFWVFSNGVGNSSNVSQWVPWEWIDPSDSCKVIAHDGGYSPTSPVNSSC